jgi:alpha-glucosidase
MYRDALGLRREFDLAGGTIDWLEGYPDDVIAFRNGTVTVITNAGDADVALPAGTVVQASGPLTTSELPPNVTVWIAS